jgi:hypothetical protein
MQGITSEQWERYREKYENLLWHIAQKINGDKMTASREDNYADLCLAAVESIYGFKAKTGKDFDEAWEDPQFHQYTKTTLWNRKAKKGIPLTKKMEFRNAHTSISRDDDSDFDFEDSSANLTLSAIAFEDMFEDKPEHVKKVVSAIIKDPSVLSPEGKVKIMSLIKPTGLSIHFVNKAIEDIKQVLNKTYD